MAKVFFKVNTDELKNKELAGLVRKLMAPENNNYEVNRNNYEFCIKPLKRILRLAKQEKEWYLYFQTIHQILFQNRYHAKYDEVVKFAELYYKESALYMDKELPNYPNTNMSFYNTWIYDDIFAAYYHYHQIDDIKMDSFMEKFEECALKYGKTYIYYENELRLCVLYRDSDRAKVAVKNFRRCEKEITTGCYMCNHTPYIYGLLLTGQDGQAEELMLDFIHKNVPKQHLWVYQNCRSDVPDIMYYRVLYGCVICCREDAFRYFYDKYWKKLPYESQWKAEETGTLRRLICAMGGNFDNLKEDLQLTEEDIEEEKHYTTVDNIELALDWWCYFTLLDRSGVHEVEIKLPGLETSDGKVPTPNVASYMEKRADEFGALFSKARARFDYEGLKGTYRNCFL